MARKPKSITTISDPLLDPFYITKDDVCYTVNERIEPNKNHFRSKGGGKSYAKPQGYYPNFEQALQKIAQEKLHTRKNYESLSLFLDEFKSIKLNIKNYTDGIRSTI
tara:strand:+ start:118 stop:438 length:321 start_codon:yes stop_codon:yes gene_type:complete